MLARYVRGLQSWVLSTRLQGRNIGPRSSPSNTSTVSVVVAVSRSFGFGARSWMETQTLDLGMEFESNKISNLCTGHKTSPVKVKIRHFTDRRRQQCISLTLPTPPHFRSYFFVVSYLVLLEVESSLPWGAMLNFQWPVWESESNNTKCNTPAPHSHLRPCNTNESHYTKERKRLIGPNLEMFT